MNIPDDVPDELRVSSPLQSLKDEFLDREVEVTTVNRTVTIGGKEYDFPEHNTHDPLLDELVKKINALGFQRIRILLPGEMTATDYWNDRVNVRIEETDPGKFVIASLGIG